MKIKFMNAYDAVMEIKSNSTIMTDGFIGGAFPEELSVELEKRYLESGSPKDLTLIYCAGQGDSKDRGLNHLGHKGLLKRVIGGHWGLVPKIQKLAIDNDIEAYNLPQGIISHLFREIAAKKPGLFTKVGLNTFVDPRIQGGKVNNRTKEDIVELFDIHGSEYMFYKTMQIDFALLRGTYADENGNITTEKEGFCLEMQSAAAACKNSGGKVIVQVEKVVEAGSLDPKLVKIPGIFVDIIVVASRPEYHMQTFGEQYNPSYSGEVRIPLNHVTPMDMSERKVICRRAAMEITVGSVINLGIGIPEGISNIANEEGIAENFVMTVEAGTIGGVPASGLSFGCATNPQAIIDQSGIFDFYHGNGLDLAFLGLAQTDIEGNINVSKFGTKVPGCGGFIDITQTSKHVFFCGTFTSSGLEVAIENGRIKILQEGKNKKFVENVEQITYSGRYARQTGQKVLYITERAVFDLTDNGLRLVEIAPGVDLDRDILQQMEFKPIISPELKNMDHRLFYKEKMSL